MRQLLSFELPETILQLWIGAAQQLIHVSKQDLHPVGKVIATDVLGIEIE